MENNSSFDSFESQLNMEAKGFLSTAAGWAMFLSIIGFLMCLLSLLGSLGMMAGSSAMAESNPVFGMMYCNSCTFYPCAIPVQVFYYNEKGY